MAMKQKMWSSKKSFIAIVGIVLLATVPAAFVGYGTDPDCIRGPVAAHRLLQTGEYHPSRMPGNPNFEYLLALIDPWAGHLGTNITVLCFFVLSIWFFYKITVLVRLPYPLLVTSIYALCPILLKNAVSTMDYIPALCALLGAYFFALRNKTIWSSVLLGISIGFRITNVIFLAPLLVLFYLRRLKPWQFVSFVCVALGLGVISFFPVIRANGLQMFHVSTVQYSATFNAIRAAYNGMNLFGLIPTVLILILLAGQLKSPRNIVPRLRERWANSWLECSTVIMFVVLFIVHPDESEYLIPVIPFLLLLFGRILAQKQLVMIGVFIISYAVVNIELKGGESGRRALQPTLAWGLLIDDSRHRVEIEQIRGNISRLGSSTKTVILTCMGPTVTFRNRSIDEISLKEELPFLNQDGVKGIMSAGRMHGSDVYLLDAVDEPNAVALRDHGFRIRFFADTVPSVLINEFHYDPYEFGMEPIRVFGEHAFWK